MAEIPMPVEEILDRFRGCEWLGMNSLTGVWFYRGGRFTGVVTETGLWFLRSSLGEQTTRYLRVRSIEQALVLMQSTDNQCDAFLVVENQVVSMELRWSSGTTSIISCELHGFATMEGSECELAKRSTQGMPN